MRKKQLFPVVAVAVCALWTAGGILASNMAFKMNYALKAQGPTSKTGTNSIALPYFRKPGLLDAFSLIQDIEGGGPPFSKVVSVSKFHEATDSLQVYTGRMSSPGANFTLAAGEGYRIQMSADVNYVVVGSHDTTLVAALDRMGPGSKSGSNDYAPPYHVTARTAFDLMLDIEKLHAPPFPKFSKI